MTIQDLANFVIIPGAWHAASHWQELIDALGRQGRTAVALDLPGHGANAGPVPGFPGGDRLEFETLPSDAARITLEASAQAILDHIGSAELSRPPIVLAHSMAGIALTRAAELAPQSFGRLVYLAAFMPIGLGSAMAYTALPEFATGYGHDLFVGDPATLGAVRIDPTGNDTYLENLRSAYYQDVPMERFRIYAQAMSPDLPIDIFVRESPVSAGRWGKVPRTYIRSTQDRALAPAIQTRMVDEADRLTPDNLTQVIELHASHSPFASQPENLAIILAELQS